MTDEIDEFEEKPRKPLRNIKSFFRKYKSAIIFISLLLLSALFIFNVFWYFGDDMTNAFKKTLNLEQDNSERIFVEKVEISDLKLEPSKYFGKQVKVSGELTKCKYVITEPSNVTYNKSSEGLVVVSSDLVEREKDISALCFFEERGEGYIKVPTNILEIKSFEEGSNVTVIGFLKKVSRISDVFIVEHILNKKYEEILNKQKELPKQKINVFEVEERIHKLVNELRKENNVSELEYRKNLANIARYYSQEMALKNYFDNVDLVGKYAGARARDAGFYCIRNESYVRQIGENVYKNYLYSSVEYSMGVPKYRWASEKEIAASTIDGWMNESSSREFLLSKDFSKQGVGVAVSGNEVIITQNLC